MVCKKCVKSIPDEAVFCPKCGSKVTSYAEAPKSNVAEENVHSFSIKDSMQKTILYFAIVIVAVLILGIISVIFVPKARLRAKISLGDKYLSEMDYDNAIVAYETALTIDPKSEMAYEGLAKSYAGKGNYYKAAKVIELGLSKARSVDSLQELQSEITQKISTEQKVEDEIPLIESSFNGGNYEEWQKTNTVLGIPWGVNILDVIDALNNRGFEVDPEFNQADKDDLFGLKASKYDPENPLVNNYDTQIRILTKVPELFPNNMIVKANIEVIEACYGRVVLETTPSQNEKEVNEIFRKTYNTMRKKYGEPKGRTQDSEVPDLQGTDSNPIEIYYFYYGNSIYDTPFTSISLIKTRRYVSVYASIDAYYLTQIYGEYNKILEGHEFDTNYEAAEYIREYMSGEIPLESNTDKSDSDETSAFIDGTYRTDPGYKARLSEDMKILSINSTIYVDSGTESSIKKYEENNYEIPLASDCKCVFIEEATWEAPISEQISFLEYVFNDVTDMELLFKVQNGEIVEFIFSS